MTRKEGTRIYDWISDLYTCPFCTGQGVVRRALKNNKYYVRCQRCGAETRHDFVTEEDAINAWNHRRES